MRWRVTAGSTWATKVSAVCPPGRVVIRLHARRLLFLLSVFCTFAVRLISLQKEARLRGVKGSHG
jgi:hypothetical protein